jgi:uncharacterized membrane protein
MIGWSAVLFAVVRSHHLAFRFPRYDLGNMVQAVWSTAHGRFLESTFGTGEQLPRLAAHVDPILALLTPLWILVPSPLTLAAAQIGACALGALPAFWLARRHLASETAAGLIALAYLSYPWLAWTALDPIHPAVFAIPLFLYCIWFLDSERIIAFTVFAILAASTGELMGLPLAFLGLWYWLSKGHRRAGIAIAFAGAAWTLICIKLIVPAFWGEQSQFYRYFETVGGSPEGVLRTTLTDPLTVFQAMTTDRDLLYLLALAVPLCGAFLLSPVLAAAAIPQLASNSLSTLGAHTDPRAHGVAGAIPFLVAASIYGLARLPSRRRLPAAAIVLAVSVGFSVLFGPWPANPVNRAPFVHQFPYGKSPAAHVDALRDAVALVPAEAPVAATNHVGSHLSARRHFFSVPLGMEHAEWIVIDMLDPWMPFRPADTAAPTWGSFNPARLEAFKRRVERSPDWQTVFARSGVYIFRRVAPA